MEAETKVCQNCKKDFIIESEDFNYYEKIKVPAPTWCPECRMVRRNASKNVWNVYWRNCDKCGKKSLSMYHNGVPVKVYCTECWWADDWDGTEYAMDYDPKKIFFEQLYELSRKVPWVVTETLNPTMVNSEYCNGASWLRNCYMIFWADYCENVYYSSILNGLKFSSDCLRGWESELCYGSTGFAKNYKTLFSDETETCVDVWFSRNCNSCTNCVGCANLRGATNCIFNVQYSKEEYKEKIKEMKLDTWSGIKELEKKAYEFWLTKPYREYHGNTFNFNVSGEFVYYSKNSQEGYIVNYAENCKWCQFLTVSSSKDCYDYSGWGANVDLIYESHSTGEKASNIKFSFSGYPDTYNTEYCMWSTSAKNCFGCVSLKRKKYCILNKQYSKDEYEKLREQIIKDMKANPFIDEKGRTWAYGEFFPHKIGLFSYNQTDSMLFFPKTKEEALAEGYSWDDFENPTSISSTKAQDLPETIKETADKILEEVIECANCARAYRIVQGELNLLRKMGLPVPHECPKCRENKRFTRMNKPGMHHRTCAKCNANIYTPYTPNDPRIVYCVKCYQQEFA